MFVYAFNFICCSILIHFIFFTLRNFCENIIQEDKQHFIPFSNLSHLHLSRFIYCVLYAISDRCAVSFQCFFFIAEITIWVRVGNETTRIMSITGWLPLFISALIRRWFSSSWWKYSWGAPQKKTSWILTNVNDTRCKW